MRGKILVAGVIGFAVGASAFGFVAVATPVGSPESFADSNSSTFDSGQKGVNAHGETFGPLESFDNPPDLFEAVATNGNIGYVRWSAFWEHIKPPASLEEALASTKQQITYVVSVYDTDGETVIGEFVGTAGGQ